MKTKKSLLVIAVLLLLVSGTTVVVALAFKGSRTVGHTKLPVKTSVTDSPEVKGCVFKTVFGEEPSDSAFIYKTPAKALQSIDKGLDWMAEAQQADGGWGAGTHAYQNVHDPHAVKSDPATTAMVSMALLRCNNTPTQGKYASNLNKAISFLLLAVENSSDNDEKITALKGTQPQVKLGNNIDVILTSQFFTNLLRQLDDDPKLKARVAKCNQKCVKKIQDTQEANGSYKGSGWAGVLQSSLATNALETAKEEGMEVDVVVLKKSKDFQKSNYNAANGNVNTDLGAGVMLYSLSSSSRASAKEAKIAKQQIETAKREGKLGKDEKVTVENLIKSGYSQADANKFATAYEVNVGAATYAQTSNVMDGFGSNGGEEFLSYLQTGEGLIVSKDTEWKKWYDNISGRLLSIQNNDGSWSGHHCITSPVFCTATCLLILSVNNDIEQLLNL